MQKIVLLFVAAAASFMFFSYIDEYENLILPLFSTQKRPSAVNLPESINEDFLKIIREFNDNLSRAYLFSEPSLLSSGSIDDGLISFLSAEINYLTKEGKVMDLRVRDIRIEKINYISIRRMRVNTSESLRLRYLTLTDRKESTTFPDAQQKMTYTLERFDGVWKVVSYEPSA